MDPYHFSCIIAVRDALCKEGTCFTEAHGDFSIQFVSLSKGYRGFLKMRNPRTPKQESSLLQLTRDSSQLAGWGST